MFESTDRLWKYIVFAIEVFEARRGFNLQLNWRRKVAFSPPVFLILKNIIFGICFVFGIFDNPRRGLTNLVQAMELKRYRLWKSFTNIQLSQAKIFIFSLSFFF